MRNVRVELCKTVDDSYDISIGSGFAASVLQKYAEQGAYFLADSTVVQLWPDLIPLERTFLFDPSEERKNLDTVGEILGWLNNAGCRRDALLVVLGGGIVGDIGGFAASAYMRGIRFVQIPTTLLSMVDSSVGGKTGVNFGGAKNNIGAFYQPVAVHIDIDFLKTLPEVEYLNGLAEVIKYGAMFDADFLEYLKEHRQRVLAQDAELLVDIVEKCCAFKAHVVKVDEKEQGVRKYLNYGHTYGHAIESDSGYAVKHGFGVATGMYLESLHAVQMGLADEKTAEIIGEVIEMYGFSRTYDIVSREVFFRALARDKKADKKGIVLAVPKTTGEGTILSGIPVADTEAFFSRVC